MDDILQMFDENVKGVYGNHTCISLQTSIDEEDENLTSHHHRHLRKSSNETFRAMVFENHKKVSFNNASEASYVHILSGQKLI